MWKKIAAISFLLILAFTAGAQKKKNNVQVTGTVKNGHISYLILNRYAQKGVYSDTISIKDNRFNYALQVNSPQWTNVVIPEVKIKGVDDFSYFSESGKIRVDIDLKDLTLSTARGTVNNDARMEYLSDNRKPLRDISNSTAAYLDIEGHSSPDDGAKDSLIYLNERIDSVYSTLFVKDTTYIRYNNTNYFTLYLLSQDFKNGMEVERVAPLYEQIKDSLKTTELGIDLKEKILKAKRFLIGNKVDTLSAIDDKGKIRTIASIYTKNRYTLIDLWASWCIPCQQEFPFLKEAYTRYSDKGLEIVGVSVDFLKVSWTNALDRLHLPWINVLKSSDMPAYYQVSGIPFNLLVDQNGKIVARNLRGEKLFTTLRQLYK